MKPLPQLSEQELYYQTKRIQREKSKAFWKEWRETLGIVLYMLGAFAAALTLILGVAIFTNYITMPPAIRLWTNVWLTNYSHVLTNIVYGNNFLITNLNGL